MTSRRDFFKVAIGAAVALGLPSLPSTAIALEPVKVLPAVDWYKRVVSYDLYRNSWYVYGTARVRDVDWELAMLYDIEPDPAILAHFDQTFKDVLARQLLRAA